VVRAQAGSREAFEALYRRHAARLNALCARIAGDRGAGEDLMQEAFLLAWRKLGDFRHEAAFGTWLHRIATHVAIGHLRKHPAWRRTEDLETMEAWLPASAGPAPEPIDLERAIAALPPRARAVLVLHDLEGLEHHEVGAHLGIEVGTSKAQLHRARQALMRRIG
jgi:RNA polymerase sigma-70 factor (ECF subfamily)